MSRKPLRPSVALLAAVATMAAGGLPAMGQSRPGSDYLAGLSAGIAQGRQEGRALQAGQSLPPDVRQSAKAAFDAGYAAGWNDAFAGYDGGWAIDMPYVVTLENGHGPITYRIGSRVPLEPGIAYYLCPDGHELCQRPEKPSSSQ